MQNSGSLIKSFIRYWGSKVKIIFLLTKNNKNYATKHYFEPENDFFNLYSKTWRSESGKFWFQRFIFIKWHDPSPRRGKLDELFPRSDGTDTTKYIRTKSGEKLLQFVRYCTQNFRDEKVHSKKNNLWKLQAENTYFYLQNVSMKVCDTTIHKIIINTEHLIWFINHFTPELYS